MTTPQVAALLQCFDQQWAKGQSIVTNPIYDCVASENSIRQKNLHSTIEPTPVHWTPRQSAVDFVPLQINSSEWNNVRIKFDQNTQNTRTKLTLQSIIRIQNYGLWRQYAIKRREIFKMGAQNEFHLFHGCPTADGMHQIEKYGFRTRYCKGGLIGDGYYFAVESSYSDNPSFAISLPDHYKQMYLCNVVVGQWRAYQGNSLPPPGYHSFTNGAYQRTMYCVPEHTQAYPEYLIHYTSTTNLRASG